MNTLRKREHQSEWAEVLMEADRQVLNRSRVSMRQLWQFTKKGLTFVKCLSLSLSQALNCREHILRLTCQPVTTKLLTLPPPLPHIPVRYAATFSEKSFLEKCSQHREGDPSVRIKPRDQHASLGPKDSGSVVNRHTGRQWNLTRAAEQSC